MHHPLSNFIASSKCKYPIIFDSNSDVLEHLLFVIGNGYHYDSGIIYDRDTGKSIYNIAGLSTPEEIARFEKSCHDMIKSSFNDKDLQREWMRNRLQKELELSKFSPVESEDLKIECFINELVNKQNSVKYKVNPYPISDYSIIAKLDENTPTWLIALSFSYCSAWKNFLSNTDGDKNSIIILEKIIKKILELT